MNVVVKEKHFVVKSFYSTLVKEARRNFGDAKSQTERWLQAVVLPLEVQIKDHKAQLQSRLDNLAKINEKTTSINEQMAILKAAENELKKQREMIEGLIQRVSAHEARSALAETPAPAGRPEQNVPVDLMQTTKMATFDMPKAAPKTAPAPAAPKAPEAPLMGDDAFAHLAKPKAPAFDPMKTQKMGADMQSTQRMAAAPGPETTQRIELDDQDTQRLGPTPTPAQKPMVDGDKTMKIPRLDPAYKPEVTQKIELNAPTQPLEGSNVAGAETTQRIDDSIWRLQEARRILKGITPK